MTPKLRAMLDEIDAFLSDGDNEDASKLWDILCGLRGPDNPEEAKYKGTSTSFIRKTAFPKVAEWESTEYFLHAWTSPKWPGARCTSTSPKLPVGMSHFVEHAELALKALDIAIPKP